jgi:hypothetical protein
LPSGNPGRRLFFASPHLKDEIADAGKEKETLAFVIREKMLALSRLVPEKYKTQANLLYFRPDWSAGEKLVIIRTHSPTGLSDVYPF